MRLRIIHFFSLVVLCNFLFSVAVFAGIVWKNEQTGPTTYALLVGINNYSNNLYITNLKYPVKDTETLKNRITDTNNGVVDNDNAIVLFDNFATKNNILNTLKIFKSGLGKNDSIIFYWSGHSHYDKKKDELYLIPFMEKTEKSLSSEEILKYSISFLADIAPLSSEENNFIFLGDGCNIGQGLISKLDDFPKISVLSASKVDEQAMDGDPELGHSPFTYFLLKSLTEAYDTDKDEFISVEEAFIYLNPKVVQYTKKRNHTQHPSIAGRFVHRMYLSRNVPPTSEIKFLCKIPPEFSNSDSLEVNGLTVKVRSIDANDGILQYLGGNESIIKRGLNTVSYLKKRWLFWNEENKLMDFEKPYTNSHAIIVAIDDYDRINDPLNRGKTGFRNLKMMVNEANSLKNALINVGFAKRNIQTIFNQKATSSTIESALKSYWKGGEKDSADRLFFYFGGHGTSIDSSAYIVTYDYDSKRPSLTTIDIEELTGRHAKNINSHHMLVAIDSCYSGLATYTLGDKIDESRIKQFRRLSLIRSDLQRKARNFLFAGTGEQKALWENGGIFTNALIEGILGKGDTNKDNLIQFDELSLYVHNKVVAKASETGIDQKPAHFSLTRYGSGKVLFVNEMNSSFLETDVQIWK